MADRRPALAGALHRRADRVVVDPIALGEGAARRASRRRRRRLLVGAGMAAVSLVALPALVAGVSQSLSESDRRAEISVDDGRPEVDTQWVPEGWRAESWLGIAVAVPGDWDHGPLHRWCEDGGLLTPRVQRPPAAAGGECSPGLASGVAFGPADDPALDVLLAQQPDAYTIERVVVDDLAVTVVSREADEAEQIAETVRELDVVDPNGCPVRRSLPRLGRRVDPPETRQTAVTLCRYVAGIPGPNLVQSERLSVLESLDLREALDDAPRAGTRAVPCLQGPGDEAVAVMSQELDVAWVQVGRCQGVDYERSRRLTAAVLYWTLSPGWSAEDAAEGLPLPVNPRR